MIASTATVAGAPCPILPDGELHLPLSVVKLDNLRVAWCTGSSGRTRTLPENPATSPIESILPQIFEKQEQPLSTWKIQNSQETQKTHKSANRPYKKQYIFPRQELIPCRRGSAQCQYIFNDPSFSDPRPRSGIPPTVSFPIENIADIEKLIQRENEGVNIAQPDSNHSISWGVLQFNGTSTWDAMEERFGFYGSPMIPSDAIPWPIL
jgi:hypothetical protein